MAIVFLFFYLRLIRLRSSFNDLNKDAVIMINMMENGKAAMMITFCSASKPPTYRRMIAMADWITPQIIFKLFGGVSEPCDDCMPRTNVAESAEVMKNDVISNMAIMEITNDQGSPLNISKMVSSVALEAKSMIPAFCVSIAVVPNAANQIILNTVGTTSTPIMNSRIVRPFETRAMNMPTNGDQAIHQDQ